MNKEISYGIEGSDDDAKWTLYSLVDTNYNGIAKNFVFEGTLEECEEKMEQLKEIDRLQAKKKQIHYVDHMTAKELIRFIANDPPELSHDKIIWQRNDYIKMCKRWIDCNENKD